MAQESKVVIILLPCLAITTQSTTSRGSMVCALKQNDKNLGCDTNIAAM